MRHLTLALFSSFLLFGCDPDLPGGADCEVTGDGFTRQDPCLHTCVEWELTCADGSLVIPDVCTAGPCTQYPDTCGPGFTCAAVNMTDWECLPDDTCASGFPFN